ncbi:MAG: hypothetical protein BWY87_01576 [Deltaproteobacteria bacterium ADurb.Bin510]|nr:MAG: hypothetical protein BWY87_01576 [Deltaproteobacteria bacterium ADurb.Bin510]
MNAAEVERLSGFQVAFGPVRAADLKAYLQAGYRATPAMRRVTFTLRDRLVLVPLELRPALKPLLIYALLALMFCGLKPEGIIFSQAWPAAIPLLILGVAAMLAGTLLTPALLPVLPGRAFSLKGLFAGLLTTAGLMFGWPPAALDDPWLQAAALIGLPAASAYLALQFTGATPFTGISGVEQEIRATRPFYGAAVALAILGLLASKLIEWGLI